MTKQATRRLAALLVADVAGYSRLMERDDAGTVARLREIRADLIDPSIKRNAGHIVHTSGDGMLVEFGSADASLRCAVEVQRGMAERNLGETASDRIEFRIGINLGDIIVDGDDIAGDGINVAARLESIAEPGGICVSGTVRDQVHGNLDIAFTDVGERHVKNIARPIRVFSVSLDPAQVPRMPRPAVAASLPVAEGSAPSSSVPPDVSVGAMPLVALSEGVAAARQAESITRELTAMLARSATIIRVIPVPASQAKAARDDLPAAARALNVLYLADGEVQTGGDATHIAMRLVNGITGEQVWSESVALNATASPAERWRGLHAVVWHLSRALISAELRRIAAQPPGETSAMGYVMRALALERTGGEALRTARECELLLEQALRLDPNLVSALVLLTRVLIQQIDYDNQIDRERIVRRMNDLTGKAVRLNDSQPTTWVLRSLALAFMGQCNAAMEASSRTLRLEPYSSGLLLQHAGLMTLCGQPAEALTLIEQALAQDPQIDVFSIVGEANLLLGNYAAAVESCEKARALSNDTLLVELHLAAAYGHLGDARNAAMARDEVRRLVPGYTIAIHRSKGYSANPEYLRMVEEQLYTGMRKAGFADD
ncbi:MAG TPA: adenylate/guanylate cyclase domain-containing protein [Casimicrobiaceae bacterium]|nr:adenylate/guanylate cyclase domain-containing protein [Casimicrobiaceae bacterium]